MNVLLLWMARNVLSMKNAVFWDVAPCRSCVNRRFGGTCRLHLQGRKIRDRGTSVSRLLQTAQSYVMVVVKIFYQEWNLSPATISLIPRHKNTIHCIILTNEAYFKLPFLDVQIKTQRNFLYYIGLHILSVPHIKGFPTSVVVRGKLFLQNIQITLSSSKV
jgi:hypothetical protein